MTERYEILKLEIVLPWSFMQIKLDITIDRSVQKPFLSGETVRIPVGVTYKNNTGEMVTIKRATKGTISGFATCDIQSYEVIFTARTLQHGCIVPANLLYSI